MINQRGVTLVFTAKNKTYLFGLALIVEYPQTCTSASPIFLNNLFKLFILLSS